MCDISPMNADQRRLRELYDAHGQQVYRRALRILGIPALAEEAMQEVFIRALQNIDQLQSGEVIRWLYRTTTRYCLNHLRDNRRRAELLDEHGPMAQGGARDPDSMLTLRALLAQADERQAQAVTYVYVDQLSQAEAAELMNVSVRTLGYLLSAFREWAAEQVSAGGVR